MSKFYDTPCELCGEGILRTGKRGRPPKKHTACPTPAAAKVMRADEDAPLDPVTKVIAEFEKTAAPKARSVLIGMRDDRMQRRSNKLRKGDVVFLGQKELTLASDPIEDGPQHVKIKFRGHDPIRVYKDGMAWVAINE